MTAPLDKLVGMVLLAAETDRESAGLEFDGCFFSAYSKWVAPGPLEGLVGQSVRSITHEPEKVLVVNFSNGKSISVSLAADDYVGPEAYCARFAVGGWAVE